MTEDRTFYPREVQEAIDRRNLRIEFAKAALAGLIARPTSEPDYVINGVKLGIDRATWVIADAVLNAMDEPSRVTKVKP